MVCILRLRDIHPPNSPPFPVLRVDFLRLSYWIQAALIQRVRAAGAGDQRWREPFHASY
ncbi:hypothetical protein C8R44DRAFT_762395 [Mycena epipterygia]|nr:hypothetical protein C8R44DRAFT_762395 [Mycena epipterygia]